MAIEIDHTMTVKAPDKLVWDWLIQPENTIGALPGAKLTEVVDETHFNARMKVRVGTVSLTYDGAIELTEVNLEDRWVNISGVWKEVGGNGSATMDLKGQVQSKDDGSTDVRFTGNADPVGRILQFGKGMMQGVGEQLFGRFAKKASKQMEKVALTAQFADDGADDGAADASADAAAAARTAEQAAEKAKAALDAAADAPTTPGVDMGPVIAKAEAALAQAEAAAAKADAAVAKAEEAKSRADAAFEMAQKAGAMVTELATKGADEPEEELNGIAVFFQYLASLFGAKRSG